MLCDGNIPPGGGLSSSSAMVVCSAIATLEAFNCVELVCKNDLAHFAIKSERLVGVNSGGMDQMASVFGQREHLLEMLVFFLSLSSLILTLLIISDFVPKLLAKPIPLPNVKPPLVFIISNSLVQADKHSTSTRNYNLRVVETRVAASILAKYLGLKNIKLPMIFKDVIDQMSGENEMKKLVDCLSQVDILFGEKREEGYEWDDVLSFLDGISREEFFTVFQDEMKIETQTFKLYQRSQHVVRLSLSSYRGKMIKYYKTVIRSSEGITISSIIKGKLG